MVAVWRKWGTWRPHEVKHFVLRGLLLLGLWALICGPAAADSTPPTPPVLVIPRVSRPPTLEDFLDMKGEVGAGPNMVRVSGFIQREPDDGKPSSQRTVVYLGYDRKNIYAVFVCFDNEARKIRARMARREDIFDDESVEIMLDTFHDQRRAYVFQTNPLGVQWDGMWTEAPRGDTGSDFNNFDSTFDTVWYSRGKLTSGGFVVWMAIPFKSLRFSPAREQSWGIILNRTIPRSNENTFWPAISYRVEGRLNQAATLSGLEGISPGRNLQFIPYLGMRSFQAVDNRNPNAPRFNGSSAEVRGGLDSKLVLNDSLVLDVTANPDFSQVESDEPQITVNQRFEVFFPEKRPFFLENGDYFQTPINLVFTRRIEDPQFGTRLSGKSGPYSVGVLLADDRGPGKSLPTTDPHFGRRASFAIGRLKRDILNQSSLGAIYTDREFQSSFNRVGGLDGRLKLEKNWTALFQGLASSTRNLDGSYQAGPAYRAELQRSGLNLNYDLRYNDISPGFASEPGFVNRVDVREIRHSLDYKFRPNGKHLLSWGPNLLTDHVWAHDGTRLDTYYQPTLQFNFTGQTSLSFVPYQPYRERLRPQDFSTLSSDRDFGEHQSSATFTTSYLRQLRFQGSFGWGDAVNFVPPGRQAPMLDSSRFADAVVTVRPLSSLRIDNTYLFDALRDRFSGRNVFNNHIIRSKWNYQFNRELSLRLILQYTAVLSNPTLTSLPTSKNFNTDFLLTYLVHPSTALYVGYNTNLQNLALPLGVDPAGNLLRGDRLINDGRQFFVKLSYLFRF